MAKDRKKLQHIHSSVPDKQPTPSTLEVGEIAVNNSKDQEFLSIKNSEDKVVRFSSDEQIVTIMEKKEVMPYKGYVRGETGPSSTSAETPTADSYGSYGITENDLLTNKSNIIVKLNQVAAGNTVKHDKVNGAKDAYNKLVNPTTDSGLTDGAGFFIDMSRYAMQDANPQFSSTTNTCRTTMSGTTIIRGLDGDCGSLLDIKVNSAKTDIETANTEITSATTVIGTNGTTISGNTTLVVSGTTTETKKGNVTETNLANKVENTSGNSTVNVNGNYSGNTTGTTTEIKIGNVTESHSGTTTETKKGDVTETNLANKTESTSGNSYNDVKLNYSGTTGGTTTEVKVGNVSESNSGTTTIDRKGNVSENNQNAYTLVTSGATTETKIGNVVENHSGTTTENKKGDVTENNLANKVENISGNSTVNVNGNYSGNTTGTTTETKVGNVTDNHSGTTTENKKGDVIENNLANKTENTTGNVNNNTTGNTIENIGGKWDVTVTSSSGTEITSCSGFTVNTNDFKVKQCDGASGSAEFDFCGGFDVNSDDINLTQCTEGQITITEKDTTINGENITINESGNTTINTTGNVVTNTSGTTTELKVGNVTENISGNSTVNINGNYSGNTSGTTTETKIGNVVENHSGTTTENKKGNVIENNQANKTENTTGNTVINHTGTTNFNYTGATTLSGSSLSSTTTGDTNFNVSGNTVVNTSGGTTFMTSGNTVIHSEGAVGITAKGGILAESSETDIIITANQNICETAGDEATFYGVEKTNIGINCSEDASATTTNIYGETIVEVAGSTDTTISTATTVIGTANTSANTATLSGSNLTVTENNTTITSCNKFEVNSNNISLKQCSGVGGQIEFEFCGGFSSKTDDFEVYECTTGAGQANIKETNTSVSGQTLTLNELTSISAKTPNTYVSGNTLIETMTGNETRNIGGDLTENVSGYTNITIGSGYTKNVSGNSVNFTTGNVTVNTSGTTRENRIDNVVENNYANYTGNTSLNHILNVSGNTEMNSTGTTCINSEKTASLYGVLKTNLGLNCTESGSANTTNIYGNTIIEKANSADTTISTATTVIGTANTSATTATLSGNTLSINESNSISIETPDATISGSNLTINEDETVINSCDKFEVNSNDISFKQCSGGEGEIEFEYCGGFSAKTDDFEVFECTLGTGQANIKETSTLISGNSLTFDEGYSISAKTPNFYVSGSTLEIKEDYVNVSAISTNYSGSTLVINENSSISAKTPSTIISGSSMDISECTRISALTNNLEVKECGNGLGNAKVYMTNTEVSGANFNVTETTEITLKAPAIVESGSTLTIDESTSISAKTPTTYLSGTTLEVKETNVNVSANTTTYSGNSLTETMTGNETYNIGGNLTEAISGNTSITVSGNTTITTKSGTTINTTNGDTNVNTTGNTNVNTTGNTCIHSTIDANFGGDTNTRIGANCSGTATSDNTYIFAETAVTINAPVTNITGDTNISGNTVISGTTNISGATRIDNNFTVSGDTYISGNTTIGGNTYLSGDTYFTKKCTAITSNELGTAICEAFDRSVVTMTREDDPSNSGLSAVYRIFQNGSQIGYDINVPKDGFLKKVELVDDHVPGVFELHFIWNIFDADTETYSTGETYVNVEDLVMDIDENNSNTGRGVDVDVWYNDTDKKMNVSATTTVQIVTDGNGTKTFSKSNAVNSLNSYKLTTSSGTFTAKEFDPFKESVSINIPTDASHITRKALTINHNGLSETYDPATGVTAMTLPHSALTINYGTNVNRRTSSTTFNTSSDVTIDIPTCVSDVGRSVLSIQYGDVHSASNSTYDPGSSCSGTGATATIPTCLENLTNWTDSCLQIQNDVCVSGDVTANNFYSTSDIRKKHNVLDIDYDSEIRISRVPLKSYVLNDDNTERKLYGVIAQDVEASGLNELVHTDEKGFKSVDYTSLLILRISHLEKIIGNLNDKLIQLEDKLNDN